MASPAKTKAAPKKKPSAPATAKGKAASKKTPWEKPAPKKSKHTALTPAEKSEAAASAKKAGRSYPNLVDNMKEVAKKKQRAAKSK